MEENDEGRRRRRRVMMSNPIAFAASSGDVSLHPLHCSMALLLCNRKKRKEKRARFWKDIRSRGSWRTTTTVLAFNLIIPRHLFLFLISFWRGRLTLLALHASNIKHTHTHNKGELQERENREKNSFHLCQETIYPTCIIGAIYIRRLGSSSNISIHFVFQHIVWKSGQKSQREMIGLFAVSSKREEGKPFKTSSFLCNIWCGGGWTSGKRSFDFPTPWSHTHTKMNPVFSVPFLVSEGKSWWGWGMCSHILHCSSTHSPCVIYYILHGEYKPDRSTGGLNYMDAIVPPSLCVLVCSSSSSS